MVTEEASRVTVGPPTVAVGACRVAVEAVGAVGTRPQFATTLQQGLATATIASISTCQTENMGTHDQTIVGVEFTT